MNDPLNDNRYLSDIREAFDAELKRRDASYAEHVGEMNAFIASQAAACDTLRVEQGRLLVVNERASAEVVRLRALAQRALDLASETYPRAGSDAPMFERELRDIREALG